MRNWEVIQERSGQPSIKRLAIGSNIGIDLVHIISLNEWSMDISIQTSSMKRFDIKRSIELDPLNGPGTWEQMQDIAENIVSSWLKELAGLSTNAAGFLDQ